MPDVRRYLSVFWGVIVMLLKQFDYLSDGRGPLVEYLGGGSVFINSLTISPARELKIRGKIGQNGYNFCVLKVFFVTKTVFNPKLKN